MTDCAKTGVRRNGHPNPLGMPYLMVPSIDSAVGVISFPSITSLLMSNAASVVAQVMNTDASAR